VNAPIRLRTEFAATAARSDTLLVLLPPALASIDDFYTHGFVDALRQRQLPVDLLLADTCGQQVLDRTVVADLHAQVMLPARANGYRTIWLAGVSLGAFSALHYAALHAGLLAGLFLLAPYPGTGDVLEEIDTAGGAAAWSGLQSIHRVGLADERAWWHWLAQQSAVGTWPTSVYLGYGRDDRFRRGQAMISDLLPQDRIYTAPGTHQWTTWKRLWEHWLDHGPVLRRHGHGLIQ
jgi:pimeloyl-ACP methyl ester carboxylesterase